MIELEHSPLGGSSAKRFLKCHGSFLVHREQLATGTFENVESEFAKLGTAAHELGASCLGLGTEPYEHIGEDFGGFIAGWPGGVSLDAVAVYVAECRRIMALTNYPPMIEQTIYLPEIHRLLKGTVDFGLVTMSCAYLRDYKNGEGVGVAAVNNPQLLYYSFLMIMATPELRDGPRDFPMDVGIIQPNFYGLYEEPDVWITSVGFVLDWARDVLLPTMHALDREREAKLSDFTSGEHCQFCPVMLDCPVLREAFETFYDGSEDFVTMLSNEELDSYFRRREDARRFMKAVENTVLARLTTGGKIPSAKLVEKQTHRVWKPGADAVLEATFGDNAYSPRKVKSPAAIEKLSSRGQALALEYGYKPESNGLVVAPITDPRPEAKRKDNASIFAAHIPAAAPVGEW